MPETAEVKRLLEDAQNEIDREDRETAVRELKEYLKKGRWNRISNPVFVKGFRQGFIACAIVMTILFFLIQPLIK
jgi:hypothetical protein